MKGLGKKILVLGSGPIVIGQACEFDYSGTQACRALKDEGATVILVNSNPATIMTDPATADRKYIEPLDPHIVEQIIAKEQPDSLLPTVGGQTALNLAIRLGELGILEKYNVELIGASLDAIDLAEDRERFAMATWPILKRVEVGSVSLESASICSKPGSLLASCMWQADWTRSESSGMPAPESQCHGCSASSRTSPSHRDCLRSARLGGKNIT